MIKAVMFCKIEHKSLLRVLEELKNIPEIKKLFSLTGDYDVLAEIEVESSEDLYESFINKIDPIEGILNTNTHIIMKSWVK